MNRNKKLLKNSLIFVIGNLGSKLISFIMVPLYTYYLSTEQFGTVDLLMTTINLCLPIVSLSLFDAVFRMTMDRNNDKSVILTTGFITSICLLIFSLLFFPVLHFFKVPNLILFFLILFCTVIFTMFQNFVRAIGYSKVFAVSGIINTFSFAILNIVMLVVFNKGVYGYLLSYLIAIIISSAFLVFKVKLMRMINFRSYSFSMAKIMLKYSIPLIPNSLAWWLTNDASKFFILGFVGVSGNGIFAVANKIPTILNVFFTVFTQAWQISAVDEYRSSDNSAFYSDVFNKLQQFLFILVAVLILIIRPLTSMLFSASYYSAWKYIPFLLLSVVFSDLSAFLGTVYLASKKTTGIFTTTIFGMIINLVLNAVLTPNIGIYGTCFGMMLGFLAVVLLRLSSVKKYVYISMNWRNFIFSILSISIMTLGLFIDNYFAGFIIIIFGFCLNIIVNVSIIKLMVTTIKKFVRKRIIK